MPELTPTPSGNKPSAEPSKASQTAKRPDRTKPVVPPTKIKPGKPARILIPTIGVNAPVDQVGTTGNAQAVPESFSRVGWWRDGVVPGSSGNAVLTGHTWSSGDGVFDRLSELDQGDVIKLRLIDGNSLAYRIRSVGEVPLNKFSSVAADIYRQTGPSGLVLMTCGDWDGSDYNSTRVVYAELQQNH